MFIYESGTGKLFQLLEIGYAGGDKGLHKEGINNPTMESQHNIGPLPQGFYTMGTPVDGSPLGPMAIPLTPDSSNQMYGRSGFFCHGDHIGAPGTASDGCIIMSKPTRQLLVNSTDKKLRVVAKLGL